MAAASHVHAEVWSVRGEIIGCLEHKGVFQILFHFSFPEYSGSKRLDS